MAIEKESSSKEGGRDEALNLEEIKRRTQDLQRRVKEAQEQKKLNLNKNIGDRESLIQEAKNIDQTLQEANESLQYYQSAQESGVEFSEEDIKAMKEVEELIASLKEQKIRVDEKINAISGMPDVLDKLHDNALTENDRIEAKKREEKARKEFEPKIDSIAQEIKRLSDIEIEKPKLLNQTWSVLTDKKGEILKMVQEAKKGFESDFKFRGKIDDAVKESLDAEVQIVKVLRENLGAIRGELGLFDGKKKKAIDFILSGNAEEFGEYEKLMGEYLKLKEDKELEKEKERVAGEYRKIIEDVRKIQDEINEKENNLPASLVSRLDNQIATLGNVSYYENGKQVQLKYPSWNNASVMEPNNQTLENIWKDINKRSNAFNLARGNSKRESGK